MPFFSIVAPLPFLHHASTAGVFFFDLTSSTACYLDPRVNSLPCPLAKCGKRWICPTEFERVSHLSTAREIWATLQAHHEETTQALKDYRHENKKRDKTFFAEMERSYSKRSSSSSSSSSSSDEEILIKKGKVKDDPMGLYFMAFGDMPKSRSHHSRRSRKSFCSMALGDKEEKGSLDNSDDDDDEKVSSYEQEVIDLLEENRQELRYREKLLRGAKKRIDELESELAMANGNIESLSSSPCLGGSSECPNCEVLLCDLTTLKSRYTERVDERDALATELESAQLELKDAHATIVVPCVDCPSHLAVLAELRAKSDE
ncbi:hypothetical protein GUJ93_ZPchr0007g4770 [Zizania palustris]|uniref:Uncharacterized protein n=1 Tax=Zizania palustris TaxID=103762 RepID=A0A8J5T7B0_ZIZPA|nr:hypothetical protein GUJ93_ZPchr0007g4770 [Zizania palustris]